LSLNTVETATTVYGTYFGYDGTGANTFIGGRNLNKQLSERNKSYFGFDPTLENDYNTNVTFLYSNDVDNAKTAQETIGKFVSNMESFKGTNMFISQYQTRNESSRINEVHGYKYNVQFFDQKSLKYWNLFVDPITSEGAEEKKMILKGRTFPKKTDEADKNK
jgi:hypothetical protein